MIADHHRNGAGPEKLPWHRPVAGDLTHTEAIARGVVTVEEVVEHAAQVAEEGLPNDPLGDLTPRQVFLRCIWASDEPADVRLTLLCIARFLDNDLSGSSMSYAQIARDCGFSEPTAKRCVAAVGVRYRDGRKISEPSAERSWLRVDIGGGRVRPGGGENRYSGICPPLLAERVR